jgi:hypothetical protein
MALEIHSILDGKKNTLFCPGIPRTGKIVIASIVINHLKPSFSDSETGNEIHGELSSIIKTYSWTFVIIDALDERKTDQIRDELLPEV